MSQRPRGEILKNKSNQKIVTDEDLVQNSVMTEKIVKNSVMDAKIDPRVVMELSMFKIGGWNNLQPATKFYWKNIWMRMHRGCGSYFQTEIHFLWTSEYTVLSEPA